MPPGARSAILLVDQFGEVGGGQTVYLQVAQTLLGAGLRVEAALPVGGSLEHAIRSRFGGALPCHGIPEARLRPGQKTLRDAVDLARYSAQVAAPLRHLASRFDVVYVNGARLFPLCLAVSSAVPARFVYHVHLDYPRTGKLLIGALLRHPRTDAVLVNSRFVLDRLQGALGRLCAAGKLRLLENALSEPLSRAPFVDRWRGPGNARLKVVLIGRIVREKGQDIGVHLAAKFPMMEFHFLGAPDFGDPGFARRLKALAGGNVVFHGRVDDVAGEIGRIGAHVNLVPSRWAEPFGLSAIEGMACSCLTVTSGRGGLGDISAQTGAWVAHDAREWEQALERIQRSSAASMASEARRQHGRTTSRYSSERFDRDLLRILGGREAAGTMRALTQC